MNTPRYHFNRNYVTEPKNYGNINLLQIGRIFCNEGDIISEHAHQNFYELTIVNGGEGVVYSNGKTYPVKSGDIHLSLPCDIHKITVNANSKLDYDFFAFTINENTFNQELKKITRRLYGSNNRVFKNPNVNSLISNGISEFMKDSPYSTELLENIFTQIIIYLIRSFSNVKTETSRLTENEVLCYQIMNYIDTHLYSIQNLEDVSPRFNYNYSYLSSLFRKTTGKTLFDYFQSRKLETSKVLILENKHSISEIALMLNYSSLFSFSKAFKAKFGISPKNLIKSQ